MNKKLASLLLSSIMLPMPLSLQAQYHSQVWNPDNGNGLIPTLFSMPRMVMDVANPILPTICQSRHPIQR